MHPLEEQFLETLAEPYPDAARYNASSDNTINIAIKNDNTFKVIAYRVVGMLHAAKIIEGNIANVSLSDLENLNKPIALGDNAGILPPSGSREEAVLCMNFRNIPPSELHGKIANLLSDLREADKKPSALQPAENAVQSVFAAAGLPIDSVQAVRNDVVVTFKKGRLPEERQKEAFEALRDAGLFKGDDVKSCPLGIMKNGGEVMWLPFPEKSVAEIQAGLFKAEILLRQRAEEASPWVNRVDKSTLVTGVGIQKH